MNNVLAWMAAIGIQLDDHQPDARQLAHIAATRDARAQIRNASSPLAGLIGVAPVHATIPPATCACSA